MGSIPVFTREHHCILPADDAKTVVYSCNKMDNAFNPFAKEVTMSPRAPDLNVEVSALTLYVGAWSMQNLPTLRLGGGGADSWRRV